MNTLEIIALIQDISIIVASGIFAVILLICGFIFLRLYPPIKRTTRMFERSSGIVLNIVSQPMGLVSALADIIKTGVRLVTGFKKEDREGHE